jgi:hypothetical protein
MVKNIKDQFFSDISMVKWRKEQKAKLKEKKCLRKNI